MKALAGELKRLLGEEPSKEAVLLLAESYPLGESLEEKFIELGGVQVARLLALNPHLSIGGALTLSRHPDPVVRSRLARRGDLPVSLFLELVKNSKGEVLEELAKNPKVPKHVQEILIQKGDSRALQALLENPGVEDSVKEVARKRLGERPLFLRYEPQERFEGNSEPPSEKGGWSLSQEEEGILSLLEEVLLKVERGNVSLGEVEAFLLRLPRVPRRASELYRKLQAFLERSHRPIELHPSL